MAGNIKGIIVEIGGDTSGLQKALSKVNSASSSLSKELRGINSLLKLDPKNTELLAQKQEVLSKNIETTKDKLNQLKDIQAKALEEGIDKNEEQQENWRALQREIINTQNKLNKFLLEQSGWTTNGRKVEEFGKKIENLGNKLNNIGNKLTSTLTTSILGIGVASGKSAIDFETAFTGVEKTVDGTTEQMNNLKQGIKDMSKQFPTTTTEIAKVAEAAGQLGIQTENILSFSKTMIDMGNSTNLSADEAATSLARFANITQMSQDEFDKLGSAIVDLGNKYATTEAEIIDMSLRLAGAGHQIGMTEGQILGLATALSSVGIEAEMGGSALSKAMVKMQTAVEMGGNKLENVLKKTGMNLRDLELLSANNSMEFKSLADSIGMTSTEVKQLITAGTNLEDFAKISGMTAEEFKNSWKKDATSALTAFIKGLGEAETKGESAITMLSEMGLTEVRLRDSLLRAANAGTLFNDAIKTGTKAWEDNVALTKEANKRYETTASKLKITINKLQDFGIKLGDKLIPIVDKWLDKADKWLDKLDDLDEGTLDNIVSIGLFVAAFGPAVKIIGKLTNTIGTGIKGLGRFTQAIAVVKTGSESANKSVNKMATGIKGLISPVGLATTTLALYSAGVGIVQAKIADEVKENKEFISTIEASTSARKDAIETINKNQNANLAEINNVQTLNNELKELVNENGKVKSGYEARVQFILNQLNNALGTEYSLNDNIINQYQNMQSSIDELIKKKEAQIILEANEEKYKEAIQNKTQAYKDYLSTQEKINEILPIYNKLLEDNQKGFIGSNYSLVDGKSKLKEYTDELKTLYSSLGEQKSIMDDYNNDILQFQKNSELMIKGGAENYQKIAESVAEIQSDITTTSNSELSKRINNLIVANEQTKKLYQLEAQYNKKAKDSIYAKNLEESEKNLQLAIDDLIAMTSTTKEMSPNVIEAWKNLAQNSRKEYNEALSKMPVDMQERINNITDTLNNDISTRDAAKFLGNDIVKNFDQSVEAEKAGKNLVSGINKGLNNKTEQAKAQNSARTFSSTILNIFHRIWDEHSPSKASEKSAINLLKGVPIGLNKEAPKVYKETEKVVKSILEKFNSNLNFNTLENLPDINTSIKRSINMTLQPKILQPNIVINTQKLDNAEMNRIIDTVNRRFGMQI